MIYYAKTHIGNVRKLNEDAVYIPENNEGLLAILADGMGGHSAGDVASSLVVSAVASFFNEADEASVSEEGVREALYHANTLVWNESCTNKNRRGMGSTATVAVFAGAKAFIGQVGDSRAYLLRNGELSQITKDHSYVQMLLDKGMIDEEQAARHPQKNVITRAIGTDVSVDVDLFTIEMHDGDIILLCSDGLSNAVSDAQITAVLSDDIQTAADKLVKAALDNGGTDNVSAVIAVYTGGAQ